ncbi:MAG: hypothetical protein AAF601_00935 [Pseudomonadota bacterium]
MMRALVVGLMFFALGSIVSADVSVNKNQRYEDLKTDWLRGNADLDTLRKLAALADGGNVAAQVLLGVISRQPKTYFHVFEALPPGERRAIFRKRDGRFGKPWLRVAAPFNDLAALLTRTEKKDSEAYAMALADAGATKIAIDFANLPANEGDMLGTLRVLSHPNLLPHTKALLHHLSESMEAGLRLSNRADEADEILEFRIKLQKPDLKDRLLALETPDVIAFADLPKEREKIRLRGLMLLHHPDLKQLIDIMYDVCPDDTAYHMGVLFYLNGGQLRLALLSPFEPVISTQDWQQSERFRGDFLRNWSSNSVRFEMLQNLSACFAAAVQAELEPR